MTKLTNTEILAAEIGAEEIKAFLLLNTLPFKITQSCAMEAATHTKITDPKTWQRWVAEAEKQQR